MYGIGPSWPRIVPRRGDIVETAPHPLPLGGVIAIGRTSPKFSGAAKWTAQLESIDSIQERIDRVAEDFKTRRWLNGAESENGPYGDSGGRS